MKFLKRLTSVSKWIVKTIDFSIFFLSVILGFFIRLNLEWSLMANYPVKEASFMYAGISLLVVFLVSGKKGVVSSSGMANVIAVLKMVLMSFMGALLVDFSIKSLWGLDAFLPISVLIITSLISFCTLMLYRLLGKEVYNYYYSGQFPEKHIVIFGAGEAGNLSKTVLQRDGGLRQKIHAFLDDDPEKVGGEIGGTPVYRGITNLALLKAKHEVTDLVISVMRISPKRKREIIDECLRLGINVNIVPSIDEWIKGGFSAQKIRKIKIEDLLAREEISLDNPEVHHQVRRKVILVTGAAGSIGSELCRQLIFNEPALLIMVDQAESALYDLEQEFKSTAWNISMKPILADIRDKKKMIQIFQIYKPDMVFHAAAYKHVPMMETFPEEAIRCNVIATKNLADLAVLNGVEKFVMISTDKAVNPTSVMGASKRVAEMYVQALSSYMHSDKGNTTKFVTTRFGNVLGSNGSVIPLFRKQIEQGGPVSVTHPMISRYFMTISEACQLILEAGAMAKGGEVYVFDMGEPVKIVDLAKKMIILNDKRVDKDVKIVYTGLREGEKLHEELVSSSEEIQITHHPKIRILKMIPISFNKINYQIDLFESLLDKGSDTELVRHMKAIVPEFVSRSSRYEVLDRMN